MTAYLYTGYHPERLRLGDSKALSHSSASDVMSLGLAQVTLDDIEQATYFLRGKPTDKRSAGRTVKLHLHLANNRVQSAMLRLVEEPPPNSLFVLMVDDIGQVLEPIVSRCIVVHSPFPDYAKVMQDMGRQGMTPSSAIKTAKQVQAGFQPDMAPDENDYSRAETLLAAAIAGDIELGVKVAKDFDASSVRALRVRLTDSISEQSVEALSQIYDFSHPRDVAIAVLRTIARSSNARR